ncbi:tRNA (guanine(10)-N2)-methyltransferase [Thelohanellus kitauei]|uniref:tRNA (guanine(10)-N(2))-methyltransferase TRMT11 n=1 Tax=Thelohanellus kitauei TaxID=669202 RepID=A0A0C2MAG9_THEKT|nr:tRNA (guanine(10)-N2)-methyltransferase [Thelohanellus kitauei]
MSFSKLKHRYSLKTRPFIGNSSLDPLLSFVAVNIAQVRPASFIIDPFVGSGSIPVAAAHFGALSFGSDYNMALILGETKPVVQNKKTRDNDECIDKNFAHYNLDGFLGAVACDIFHPSFRITSIFDAVITDPPYGVREKIRS